MHMILLVLDNPDQLDEILDAWDAIGIQGVTIIESTGINRRRASQVGQTFMAGINRLMSGDQESNFTLFTIVSDEDLIQKCLAATESITGDLRRPNSGVFAAWPLEFVKGIPKDSGSEMGPTG